MAALLVIPPESRCFELVSSRLLFTCIEKVNKL